MKYSLAVMLLLASTEWSIADHSKIQKLMSKLNCKTILLNRAHPRAVLRGGNAVWALVNNGPASAVVRTNSDPTFSSVYKPYAGGNLPVFVGDSRYRYTIGLPARGAEAKVHVCTAPS